MRAGIEKARRGSVKVYPVGAATRGLAGKELTEMGELAEMGCVAFSDDGNSIADGGMMRASMRYAATFGRFIMAHEEDISISGSGVMNEGYHSTVLGLPGISRVAEETMIARDLLSRRRRTCTCTSSTCPRSGVRMIRDAKSRGVKVT